MPQTPHSSYPESYYAATRTSLESFPSLLGTCTCDVVVVGAGFTGLSCALSLQELGYKTVLIDRQRVGWGASGRNGGHIVNGYSRDFDSIEKQYGFDMARAHAEMALLGSEHIRDLVTRYNIPCDYAPGQVSTAITNLHCRGLESRMMLWRRFKLDHLKYLDSSELTAYVKSPRYRAGLLDPQGGHIHPLNLAIGEAQALHKCGGRIFENTAMLHLETVTNGVEVTTGKGRIKARYAVLAGNAYAGAEIPDLWKHSLPCGTSMIATEPLDKQTARSILPQNVCIEDCAYILDYFRLSADNRLLFGGGVTYNGNPSPNDPRTLMRHLRRVFPDIKDLQTEYSWSGLFCLTRTRLPTIGARNRHIFFAGGYSGHGVSTSHLAGSLLSKAIHGDSNVLQSFQDMPPRRFPGGRRFRIPITFIGALWYRMRDMWQF